MPQGIRWVPNTFLHVTSPTATRRSRSVILAGMVIPFSARWSVGVRSPSAVATLPVLPGLSFLQLPGSPGLKEPAHNLPRPTEAGHHGPLGSPFWVHFQDT